MVITGSGFVVKRLSSQIEQFSSVFCRDTIDWTYVPTVNSKKSPWMRVLFLLDEISVVHKHGTSLLFGTTVRKCVYTAFYKRNGVVFFGRCGLKTN